MYKNGKYVQDIQVGDVVRSYDFDGSDAYVQGQVMDIYEDLDCDRYSIMVTEVKRSDEDVKILASVDQFIATPPVNGTPTSMGNVIHCVEKVTSDIDPLDAVFETAMFICQNTSFNRKAKVAMLLRLLGFEGDNANRDAGYVYNFYMRNDLDEMRRYIKKFA